MKNFINIPHIAELEFSSCPPLQAYKSHFCCNFQHPKCIRMLISSYDFHLGPWTFPTTWLLVFGYWCLLADVILVFFFKTLIKCPTNTGTAISVVQFVNTKALTTCYYRSAHSHLVGGHRHGQTLGITQAGEYLLQAFHRAHKPLGYTNHIIKLGGQKGQAQRSNPSRDKWLETSDC